MGAVDPTGWFEQLYVSAAEGDRAIPWDRGGPHPLLDEWARTLSGAGRRALVVGSGLGPDAELLAARGFDVTAFDVSPTAIESARARFPESAVDYRVANLLAPPAEWREAFDLVVESLTVQSMPIEFHPEATASVARMVAPGGRLLVIATGRTDDADVPDGPPWPLTRAEIDAFAAGDLEPVRVERVQAAGVPPRWRAEFRRRRPHPGR